MYVFEEKRMIPKREFQKLWRKLKNLCMTFDKRCQPKFISYQQQCKHIKENFRYDEVHDIRNFVRNNLVMEDESLKQHVIQWRFMQFSFLLIILQYYIRGKTERMTQLALTLKNGLTTRSWRIMRDNFVEGLTFSNFLILLIPLTELAYFHNGTNMISFWVFSILEI